MIYKLPWYIFWGGVFCIGVGGTGMAMYALYLLCNAF